MKFLISYFEVSNERILKRETGMRGSAVKCGERALQGGGYAKYNVRPPMNNDAMEAAVEYMWVDTWCVLDWIIGLCHKTVEMHFASRNGSTSE